MNQVHWHIHAKRLELMLLRQEFDEKNVFVVVFVELLKQNQNRECPKLSQELISIMLIPILTAGKAKNEIAKIAKNEAMIFPTLKYSFEIISKINI
jgi:hypothetical protein